MKKEPPWIAEIIGPAGTGKTALSRALQQDNSNFVIGPRFELRTVGRIVYSVSIFLWLLPTLVRQRHTDRLLSRDEVKRMVYLKGWHRVLKRQVSRETDVIVLDQGPIFNLATLRGFGPALLKSRGFEKWWERMFTQWAQRLDMVVWLDAPDDILIERIETREKWHVVKDVSFQDKRDFYSEFRSSNEYVVSKMIAINDIKVLRFDTSRCSLEQISKEVADFFEKGC